MNNLQFFLKSVFRRDGLVTIGKLFRYGVSPKAWRWLLSNLRNRRLLKESGIIDEAWYRREYPDVPERGADPIQDLLDPRNAGRRKPNPDFDPVEYKALHFDVLANPTSGLIHYARNGLDESRETSFLESMGKPFPPGAQELRQEFDPPASKHRRTAIVASFSADGHIPNTLLYLLRGLREVVDNIVLVANNPVFPAETEKLAGIVRLAVFRHHGCYDFGSYKAGWAEAEKLGLLDPDVCDELVLCNDSCYGPVFPFSESFAEMEQRNQSRPPDRPVDFWGMVQVHRMRVDVVSSFFYVFRKSVLESGRLGLWFERLEPYPDRGRVVVLCEYKLTPFLKRNRFRFDSLVPLSFAEKRKEIPHRFPLSTLRGWRMPLVRKKAFKGETFEPIEEVVSFVREVNPELAALLPSSSVVSREPFAAARRARENHAAELERVRETIRKRDRTPGSGLPVRVVFFALAPKPFPWLRARLSLAEAPGFECRTVAVPDLRIADNARRYDAQRAVRAALLASFPKETVPFLRRDSQGEWPDFAAEADVVCYGTAEDVSDFRYNPHWAVGRSFLPILVFDRQMVHYPFEKEFARQNYAYFWKVFFGDHETFDLYAKHSIRRGDNAVLAVGGDAATTAASCLKKAFSTIPARVG